MFYLGLITNFNKAEYKIFDFTSIKANDVGKLTFWQSDIVIWENGWCISYFSGYLLSPNRYFLFFFIFSSSFPKKSVPPYPYRL